MKRCKFISTVTLCVAMATARKSQSYEQERMSESDGDEGDEVGDEGDHNPLPALDETVLLACLSGLKCFKTPTGDPDPKCADHPDWAPTLAKYVDKLVKFQNEHTVGGQSRLFERESTGPLQLYWPREMILLIKTKLREQRDTCDRKTEREYKHQLGDELRAQREAALRCVHALQVGDKIGWNDSREHWDRAWREGTITLIGKRRGKKYLRTSRHLGDLGSETEIAALEPYQTVLLVGPLNAFWLLFCFICFFFLISLSSTSR